MSAVSIGDRLVGAGHPCYVIAEVGSNHNRDLDTARRCHELGARYVETMAVQVLRAAYDEAVPAA